MTISNLLTLARASAVVPVIALVAMREPVAALGVFVIGVATDVVDGPIARRRGEVTALGTFLDPLADKILIVGALAALATSGLAPAWALAIVVARELVAIEVRIRSRGALAASADGKAKTALQAVAVAALLAGAVWPSASLAAVSSALLVGAVALTVLSGVMLIRRAA